MEKQDLKNLLENIYHLLAEAPLNEYQSDPNFVGPPAPALYIPPYGFPVVPITTPTTPTAPITPTLVDPETPMWTPELEQWLRDRVRESTPGGWLGIRGFPPAGVPPLPGGFPTGAQEWYQNLTPEQRQLLLDWIDQHFNLGDLYFNHREFFEEVLRGKHSQQELLKWLKENWPELYQP